MKGRFLLSEHSGGLGCGAGRDELLNCVTHSMKLLKK